MGTVKGDVHDIGKNLVNIMLEGAGFEVIDLGVQVAPEKFVAAIEEHQPDIVGFSAFLTTTMPMFKANMNALEKAGIRDTVIVMVGGAPVTQEYADAVGADGYAADASATRQARQGPAPREARARCPHERPPQPLETVLRSATKEVVIGHGRRFCLIGERINPTGRRIFQEQLRAGDLSAIERDVQGPGRGRRRRARHQHGRAADRRGRAAGQGDHAWCRSSPTCRSASTPRSSRRSRPGSSVYQGRALVNSITAEDDRMAAILPLVKKYDAAIIALPNDHDEIPMEADKRLDLTAKIIRGRHHGVRHRPGRHRDRPAGHADRRRHHAPSLVTLETMRRIRDEFGVNMTCGASNVSFGMPDRHTLGAAFLPMAMTAGLTSAIMDTRTPQIVEAVKAADLFLGHDEWGMAWIAAHRGRRRQPRRREPTASRPRADGARRTSPSTTSAARACSSRRAPSRRRTTAPAGSSWPSPCADQAAPRDRPAHGPGAARRHASSTPRRGTASPSTPPAAATAPATSARCGSTAATCRSPGTTRAPSPPTQLDDGWRLACLVQATRDLAVDVPPLTTRPKAATVGVGRQVILRPAVQKRYVELDRADARRPAHRPRPAARRDRRPRADRRPARRCAGCRRCCAQADFKVTAVVVDEALDRRRARRHHRRRATRSPSTSAPRPWSPPCSTSPPAPRSRWPRCSTSSSPSAAT